MSRSVIERWFQLHAQGTNVRTELLGGVTTFVTLSYIIFVQPAVLATTGMDAGAVMTATCRNQHVTIVAEADGKMLVMNKRDA